MVWVFVGVVVVLAVAGLVAMLVTVLVRKAADSRAELAADLAGRTVVRGPEKAVYRGNTGSYPHVLGNGLIVLTDQQILFRKTVGVGIDVELADVRGVSQAKTFNGGRVGGQTHLVVHTGKGDVGYFVTDLPAWISAVESARLA